jgi:hypothetical protein
MSGLKLKGKKCKLSIFSFLFRGKSGGKCILGDGI